MEANAANTAERMDEQYGGRQQTFPEACQHHSFKDRYHIPKGLRPRTCCPSLPIWHEGKHPHQPDYIHDADTI